MKKRAFTIAEVAVALIVFGIIAAAAYPVLSSLKPDNNMLMIKRAYYQAETVVEELINSPLYPPGTDFGAEFPQRFQDKLNIASSESATKFQTADGTAWEFESPTVLNVTVNGGEASFTINIRADGKMGVPDDNTDGQKFAIKAIQASTYR